MRKINKNLEILDAIDKAGIINIEKLADTERLQGLYSSSKYPRRRIIDSVRLMAKQGFISLGKLDNDLVAKITKKGKNKLTYYRIIVSQLKTSGPWQNQWHMITFDIPENYKVARNKFIILLKDSGFLNYTKGMWISPYDNSAFIKKIATMLGISRFVRTITATHIDKQSMYKKRFKIS